MDKEQTIEGLFEVLANHNGELAEEERKAVKQAIKLLSQNVTTSYIKEPVKPIFGSSTWKI